MEYKPDDMCDPLRELREQIKMIRRLVSMTALDQALVDATRLDANQIRETVLSHEQVLMSVKSTRAISDEIIKQMDFRRQIEASNASKALVDMFDNYKRMLHPPPLPDEFGNESEEDGEEKW